MSNSRLNHDATASSKGTIYQFCVAVQKCYEMTAGQKVLIESQGDVTISGSQQVETKFFSDLLTDGHINFWKTLHNWMQDKFDPMRYTSLILYTTQQYGERATISKWNESIPEERLNILQSIYQQAEKREADRQKKVSRIKPKTPDVLLLQRFILDTERSSKLIQIIEKFAIEACSPELPELHSIIKQQYIKGILDGKKDDFLAALFGFIAQPQATKAQSWEITYDDFDKKVGDLTTLYCRETREFPRKYFSSTKLPDSRQMEEHHNYIFVRKIQDIEHHIVIPEAIRDYLGAVRTIHEELRNYEVPPSRTDNYIAELVEIFIKRHRIASRRYTDIITDSQNFFDEVTTEEPREFEGFKRPPIGFRNGLLHTQLDDIDKKLQWKLEK